MSFHDRGEEDENLPCISTVFVLYLPVVLPGASGPLTPKSVSLGTGELQSSSASDRRAPESFPIIPDYEVLRLIGRGAYGEVWLAQSTTGLYRAVKVVRRSAFDHDRPFEREFESIQKFEPISIPKVRCTSSMSGATMPTAISIT